MSNFYREHSGGVTCYCVDHQQYKSGVSIIQAIGVLDFGDRAEIRSNHTGKFAWFIIKQGTFAFASTAANKSFDTYGDALVDFKSFIRKALKQYAATKSSNKSTKIQVFGTRA